MSLRNRIAAMRRFAAWRDGTMRAIIGLAPPMAAARRGCVAMSRLRRKRVGRPGAVAGMLAMLGLALVGPIHHLHAIARDFGAAHHASVAAPAEDCHEEHAGHGGTPPAKQPTKSPVYCPVCTLGKMAAALLPPGLPALAAPLVRGDPPIAIVTAAPGGFRPAGIARPRAPPVAA